MSFDSMTYWISPERYRIWRGCLETNRGTENDHGTKSCVWCFLTKKYPWCGVKNAEGVHR